MKVEIGKVYANKTLKYILPLVRKYYDKMLVSLINSVSVLAVGVGDFLVKKELSQHIFILVDSKVNSRIFTELLYYIMDKEYYEDNYPFDHMSAGSMQMIVFKLPDDIIETFFKGKYSEIYSFTEACELIIHDETFNIIMKNPDHRTKFIQQLKVEYQAVNGSPAITLTDEEIGDRELDIPPIKKNEIFNYKEPIN